jgi:hypothetical protein
MKRPADLRDKKLLARPPHFIAPLVYTSTAQNRAFVTARRLLIYPWNTYDSAMLGMPVGVHRIFRETYLQFWHCRRPLFDYLTAGLRGDSVGATYALGGHASRIHRNMPARLVCDIFLGTLESQSLKTVPPQRLRIKYHLQIVAIQVTWLRILPQIFQLAFHLYK